jgi:hypothetical protein
MKQSGIYRQNAENCAYLAEGAANEPVTCLPLTSPGTRSRPEAPAMAADFLRWKAMHSAA